MTQKDFAVAETDPVYRSSPPGEDLDLALITEYRARHPFVLDMGRPGGAVERGPSGSIAGAREFFEKFGVEVGPGGLVRGPSHRAATYDVLALSARFGPHVEAQVT